MKGREGTNLDKSMGVNQGKCEDEQVHYVKGGNAEMDRSIGRSGGCREGPGSL